MDKPEEVTRELGVNREQTVTFSCKKKYDDSV